MWLQGPHKNLYSWTNCCLKEHINYYSWIQCGIDGHRDKYTLTICSIKGQPTPVLMTCTTCAINSIEDHINKYSWTKVNIIIWNKHDNMYYKNLIKLVFYRVNLYIYVDNESVIFYSLFCQSPPPPTQFLKIE